MTNAEIIQAIRKEIERLESIEYPCDNSQQSTGFFNALDRMTDFLSTLEEQECPEYCVRSHCIGCSKYNPDEWSNKPRKARVKATGEIVEGFTDGQGHFDVFTDHNICTRYDVNAIEFDTLESEKPMNQEELKKEAVNYCFDNGLNLSPRVATDFARHFAEWGYLRAAEKYNEIEYNRQRAEGSVPSDLEEAAKAAATEVYTYTFQGMDDLIGLFKAGAKWQKQHDAELIEIAYNDGITIGMTKQKEQMMKEAVEGVVQTHSMSGNTVVIHLDWRYKHGDKVRIIVVKE